MDQEISLGTYSRPRDGQDVDVSNVFKVKRLAVFIFEMAPDCRCFVFDSDNLKKIGQLKTFEQSFSCKCMTSFP